MSTTGKHYFWNVYRSKICPEMYANEIHELYDRDHKVAPNLNSY